MKKSNNSRIKKITKIYKKINFAKKSLYFIWRKTTISDRKFLRGRVKFPTGGKVREPFKADPV